MGTPDDVRVPCPACGAIEYFQSKGGECAMLTYNLADAPNDVLSNVNRHSPYRCRSCGTWFAVDEENRSPIAAEKPPENSTWGRNINWWYSRE